MFGATYVRPTLVQDIRVQVARESVDLVLPSSEPIKYAFEQRYGLLWSANSTRR